MTGRGAVVAGCLLAAGLGAAVPGQDLTVPLALALATSAALLSLSIRMATLGYLVFASTLLTRIRLPGLPLLPEQALMLLTVGALVMRGRSDILVRAARLLPKSAWCYVLWGGAISVVRSPDVVASMRIVSWLASSLFTASLLCTLCINGRARVNELAGRFAAIASAGAVVGVMAWVVASMVPGSSFGVQVEGLTGSPAAYGLSFEANIFGGICAVWLVVDVLYVHRSRASTSALIRALLGLGVLVSLTRAAALAVVIGVIVGSLATRRTRRAGASVMLVGGLAVSGLFLVGPTVPVLRPVVEKGAQLLDFDSSTSVVRRQSWELALDDMSAGTALTGQGVNSFGQRHADPSRPEEKVPGYLSNVFLQIIYDTGVIGLGLLVSAAVTLARRLRPLDARVLGVLACGAIVGVATSPMWFASWWVVAALGGLGYETAARRRLGKVEPTVSVQGLPGSMQSVGPR